MHAVCLKCFVCLIFLYHLNMSTNFSENDSCQFVRKSFNGSRLVPCGQKDGSTDLTRLVVIFSNFSANAPSN